MSDDPGLGMSFSLDHVTSKIAYAYSKQQAFVWFGSVALLATLGPLLAETGDASLLAGDAVTMACGAAVLALAFTQRDLRRINRNSLLLAVVVLLAQVGTLAAAVLGPKPHPTSAEEAAALLLAVTAGAMVVGYPLPVRRGDTVLFRPSDIADLSESRTLGAGSVFLAGAGAVLLLVPHASAGGTWVPAIWLAGALLGVGVVGFVLYAALPRESFPRPWALALPAVGVLVAAVDLVNGGSSVSALGPGLLPVLGIALVFLVVLVLASRLNQGRTILGRRA